MPDYDPNRQQPAEDSSSIGSWLSASLRSLASSIVSLASNILPGQRYDPVQHHPDDNSSIGSVVLLVNNQSNDQDNTNRREHDENASEPAQLNYGEPTRSQRVEDMPETFAPTVEMMTRQERQTDPLIDERSMRQSRTRRFQVRIRDIRVMLFSTVDSRRVKFVNWFLLPLNSVLYMYYLVFSPMVSISYATSQGLTALSIVLLSYHKVQSIRTLNAMTLSANFSELTQFQKRLYWLWLMLYTIAYVIELVIFIDSWFSFFGEHFNYVTQAIGVLSIIIGFCSMIPYIILESILDRKQTQSFLIGRIGYLVVGPSYCLITMIHWHVMSIETARGLTLLPLLWLPAGHPNGL